MVDARKFLLSTDYKMDLVSAPYEGSINVPANSFNTSTTPHNLGYRPLFFARWSTDPSFTTSYDEIGTSTINPYSFTLQIDGTNMYVTADNFDTNPVTVYFRVIFFMPFDVNLDVAPNALGLGKFQFNSDFNYPKILLEGKTTGANATILHDLGYYPQVEVWYIRALDGRCVHFVASTVTSTATLYATITPTSLILTDLGSVVGNWYYRIYADEN